MNLFISNSKKTLILGLSLFIACQFMFLCTSNITQTASKQVVQEKRSWARAEGLIKAKTNKDLILFFGNSHMAAGIIPDVFDAVNGNTSTSYNLSLVGLQLPVHYFLLKDYLRHNPPPQYILLNPTFQGYDVESFPSYAIQGAGLREVILYAFYRKNMDVFFNYIFPARVHWPETIRYFTGKILALMPTKIRDLHKRLYLGRFGDREVWGHNRPYFYESQFIRPEELRRQRIKLLEKQRGYYYVIEESIIGGQVTEKYLNNLGIHLEPCPSPLEDQAEGDIIPPIDPISDEFFQLARAKGIPIVLLPEYTMDHHQLGCIETTGRYTMKDTALYQYLHARYGNVYSLTNYSKIEYPYKLFSDPSHLNPQGAKIHTQNMAQAFKLLKEKLKN